MTEIPYSLIAKYLSGNCSSDESRCVDSWVNQSPENAEIFKSLSIGWSASSIDREEMEKSRKAVWNRIAKVVPNSRFGRVGRHSGMRSARFWVASAAVVLLIAALSFSFVRYSSMRKLYASQRITVSTLPGQKSKVVLPDGTQIWLNSGTVISYPSDYNIKNRDVTLEEGEAFFDVAKSPENKFILNAGKIGVKVYGTKFVVSRYSDDPGMDVVLQSGHVDVLSDKGGRLSEMHPGQKFVFDKKSGKMVLSSCDASLEGLWRYGKLVIEHKNLAHVASEMERWYGVSIDLSGNYDPDACYWMTIKTESLREMLVQLDKLIPLTYKIDGDDVSISFHQNLKK